MGTHVLGEVASASAVQPSAGRMGIFVDTADEKLKKKNSAGTVTVIEATDYVMVTKMEAFATASALTNAIYYATADGLVTVQGTGVAKAPQGIFRLRAADFATGTNLRVAAQLHVNATAPTINIVYGLHPVTAVAGAAGLLQYTVGAAVASSTVTFATPAASSQNHNVTSNFALPADGYYLLAITPSAAGAASSVLGLSAQLQVVHP